MNAVEVIKKIAEDETKKLHLLELGVVTSIFPHAGSSDKDNYECNVRLKNRDLELRKIPIATSHIGLVSVPNVGDLVVLGFVGGNINAPLVLGRLYNDEDRPPVNDAGEIVYKSPDSKKNGVRRLNLELPNDITITITDDEFKAEIGSSVVTIKTGGAVTIDSNAGITIKAKGDMAFSGSNIKIESQQALELKAGTTGTLKASATLDISGAMVNIN
jgi:phage baseplate assembly protein gpV